MEHAESKETERRTEEARLLDELMRMKRSKKKCEVKLLLDGSGYIAKAKVEHYV